MLDLISRVLLSQNVLLYHSSVPCRSGLLLHHNKNTKEDSFRYFPVIFTAAVAKRFLTMSWPVLRPGVSHPLDYTKKYPKCPADPPYVHSGDTDCPTQSTCHKTMLLERVALKRALFSRVYNLFLELCWHLQPSNCNAETCGIQRAHQKQHIFTKISFPLRTLK